VLRELKSVSSGWVHDEVGVRHFHWQALAQDQEDSPPVLNTLDKYSG